ncbi:MAG TPA: DUF3368 domain-containing protein [Candidatus Moranbacteria bacterium]|nr:DUF3368 domain-containing protein [Candidatus Moranbacteria bacterium]
MIAVFDSSPWIFLSKLGIIEPAISLFSKNIVPYSVKEEIVGRNDEATSALERLHGTGSVEILNAKSSRFVNALRRKLGKGESEAIVVALGIDADYVILDDHVARSIARQLGLSVKGTLGIIRKLIELGEFTYDLKDLYKTLRNMGFWVKEDLFWDIYGETK